MNLMPKSLLLAVLLSPLLPAQAVRASHTFHSLPAPARKIIAIGALYAGSWLYNKYRICDGIQLGRYNLLYGAKTRYEMPIALVAAYANNPNDHADLYRELLGLVNMDNAAWSKTSSPYHNYPLVEFVIDLDWYIQRTWYGSWFTMPTKLSSDLYTLMQQLERVRYYCVRHPDYMDQRRRADELAATPAANHVVIH